MTRLRESGRILYISSVDFSLGNGPGVNEREFALALYNAIGERAHFLTPRPRYPFDELPSAVCTWSRPHREHHPLHWSGHMVSQARLANRLIAMRRFDLLVFRLDILPLAPRYLTRRHRIPFAVKTLGQGTISTLEARGGWPGKFFEAVNRGLIRSILKDALVADVVSPLIAEFIGQTLAAGNIVCIDNAVNTGRFYPVSQQTAREETGLTGFDPILCYAGTRPWERGGAQMIEAAPRLLEKHPHLGLVILGGGPGLAGLRERARQLGVEARCVFTGQVPYDRVPAYINASDVGVSISTRSDRERASELKVRQYLACGKPVVASPSCNEFLAAENLGSIVTSQDIDAVTLELDRWLSLSAGAKSEFSRRAFQFAVDHLSVESALARRLEIWEERLSLGIESPG